MIKWKQKNLRLRHVFSLHFFFCGIDQWRRAHVNKIMYIFSHHERPWRPSKPLNVSSSAFMLVLFFIVCMLVPGFFLSFFSLDALTKKKKNEDENGVKITRRKQNVCDVMVRIRFVKHMCVLPNLHKFWLNKYWSFVWVCVPQRERMRCKCHPKKKEKKMGNWRSHSRNEEIYGWQVSG